MIQWLKELRYTVARFIWPCKHGIIVRDSGVVVHESLQMRSTHIGNVYKYEIVCIRCGTPLALFQGIIKKRELEYPVIVAPSGVNIWNTGE